MTVASQLIQQLSRLPPDTSIYVDCGDGVRHGFLLIVGFDDDGDYVALATIEGVLRRTAEG